MDDLSRGGIYRIVNVANGKEYIGSARCFEVRWRIHERDLKANKHHSHHLQHANNRYGTDAFRYEVLEYVDDVAQLVIREQQYMDIRKPAYNARPRAANQLGLRHRPESKKRNSDAHMGLHHSPETCAKMSKTRTGRKLHAMWRWAISAGTLKRYDDPAERQKTSDALKGRELAPEHFAKLQAGREAWLATPESREVLRQNALEQFSDPEMRHKAGNGNRGRKQTEEEKAKRGEMLRIVMATPEYKAKASAVRKSKAKSPETRAKTSASQRQRLKNPELLARISENTRQQWVRAKAEGKTTLGEQANPGQLTLFD